MGQRDEEAERRRMDSGRDNLLNVTGEHEKHVFNICICLIFWSVYSSVSSLGLFLG